MIMSNTTARDHIDSAKMALDDAHSSIERNDMHNAMIFAHLAQAQAQVAIADSLEETRKVLRELGSVIR